jgi:hypothetical protein
LTWVCVAVALFAIWMLLVDTREEPQLIAGAAVAAIAAGGSELVRRQRLARVRVRGRWLLRLWRPLLAVPRDLGRLTLAALRAAMPGSRVPAGRLRALGFEPGRVGEGADPEDVGRRALLVHQLVPEEKRPRRSIDPLGLR